MIDERALNIYTDGSSRPKPRRGGVGIRFVYVDDSGSEVFDDVPLPGYLGATSNEMELNACVLALKLALPYLQMRPFNKIMIFTDSSYIVNHYRNAMWVWPKTKWRKKSDAPVLNARLWKDLIKAMRRTGKVVTYQKVKGHSDDEHNAAVNRLARQSAAIPLNEPLVPRVVRRKRSEERTRLGSVGMAGQRITIRIIQGEWLSVQKLFRYRYEVVSKQSPFFRKVDFICSAEPVRETHIYHVRLNTEADNPRIVKVYHEVIERTKPQSL